MRALYADTLKTFTLIDEQQARVFSELTSFVLRVEEIKMKTLKLDFCLKMPSCF